MSDRLLELTKTISPDANNRQVLDKLKVEQERGITVKAQTASMVYNYNGEDYLLNLIDTPGHVDFRTEVSRSLAACQGCILLIDATQGIQAQTVCDFSFVKWLRIRWPTFTWLSARASLLFPCSTRSICQPQMLHVCWSS